MKTWGQRAAFALALILAPTGKLSTEHGEVVSLTTYRDRVLSPRLSQFLALWAGRLPTERNASVEELVGGIFSRTIPPHPQFQISGKRPRHGLIKALW